MEQAGAQPWYRELTRDHWFVLIVASLGWLFDTMDQQLFNLARRPAIVELLGAHWPRRHQRQIAEYAGYATMIFMIGLGFGRRLLRHARRSHRPRARR